MELICSNFCAGFIYWQFHSSWTNKYKPQDFFITLLIVTCLSDTSVLEVDNVIERASTEIYFQKLIVVWLMKPLSGRFKAKFPSGAIWIASGLGIHKPVVVFNFFQRLRVCCYDLSCFYSTLKNLNVLDMRKWFWLLNCCLHVKSFGWRRLEKRDGVEDKRKWR